MVFAYNAGGFDSAFPADRFASFENMCAAPTFVACNTVVARLNARPAYVAWLWVDERKCRVVKRTG
jgi:hypothetical protein